MLVSFDELLSEVVWSSGTWHVMFLDGMRCKRAESAIADEDERVWGLVFVGSKLEVEGAGEADGWYCDAA